MFYFHPVFLLICTLSLSTAQQCQVAQLDDPVIRHSVCVNRLSTNIWTWSQRGLTQEFLWAQGVDLFSSIGAMPYECAQSYLQLMCSTVLSNCETINTTDHLIPVCRSVCVQTNDKCAGFWLSYGLHPIDCTQISPLTQSYQWPETRCYVPRNDTLPYPCPSPLIYVGPDKDYYTGLPCSSTCNTKLKLQQPYFDDMFTTVGVLNIISLMSVIFVMVVYLAIRPLRSWPQRVIVCMGVGMLCQHGVMVINFFLGVETALCQNEYEISTTGWAVFSAFMLLTGALITAGWWVFQAGLLFWCIGLLRKDLRVILKSKFMYAIHVWNWAYPVIAAITCLLASKENVGTGLGGLEGIPWAFTSWYSINGVVWAMFYAVILVYLACVLLFGLVGMYRLWSTDLSQSPLHKHNFQVSLILFTLVYTLIAVSIVANKSWNDNHLSDIEQGLSDWYECVLLGGINCEPSYRFSAFLTWLVAICSSTQGSWLAIIFVVLSRNVRVLIYRASLNIRWGRPLNEDIGINSMVIRTNSKSNDNDVSREI